MDKKSTEEKLSKILGFDDGSLKKLEIFLKSHHQLITVQTFLSVPKPK